MDSTPRAASAALQKGQKPKAKYLPILGSLLGVAVKSVVPRDAFFYEEKCEGSWTEPNKETGKVEKHLYHSGESLGADVRTDQEVVLVFEHPALDPLRTTLHLNRNSLPMAAGRMNEEKPFGLSLENQYYLNLVYMSERKPAGFEPLFLKVRSPNRTPQYLRVSVSEKSSEVRKFLTVIATLVPESEAPAHLMACDLSDLQVTARAEVTNSLRARYVTR
jgi:hypothetical protein